VDAMVCVILKTLDMFTGPNKEDEERFEHYFCVFLEKDFS